MTIDERAKKIAANLLASFDGEVFWEEASDWNTRTPDPNLVAGVAAAMREAVAEECEACAVIADQTNCRHGTGDVIAGLIRARATHPEPPQATNPPPQPPRHGGQG